MFYVYVCIPYIYNVLLLLPINLVTKFDTPQLGLCCPKDQVLKNPKKIERREIKNIKNWLRLIN